MNNRLEERVMLVVKDQRRAKLLQLQAEQNRTT